MNREAWNRRYANDELFWSGEPNLFLVEQVADLAAERGVEIDWVPTDLLEFDPGSGCFALVLVFYLQVPWSEMQIVLSRAARAVAPGGTFLLVGHDRRNLKQGHGGPSSEKVLYTPDEVAGELGQLEIVEAATRLRPVEFEDRTVHAIDCIVRAVREP